MVKLYDFLYYCCYCAILKGKNNGTGEERASFMLSTFTSIFLISVYFLIISNVNIYINPNVLFVLILALTIINVYFTSYRFVRTGRFKKVVQKYQRNPQKVFLGIIAWFFFIGSFALFTYAGIKTGSMFHKKMSQETNWRIGRFTRK